MASSNLFGLHIAQLKSSGYALDPWIYTICSSYFLGLMHCTILEPNTQPSIPELSNIFSLPSLPALHNIFSQPCLPELRKIYLQWSPLIPTHCLPELHKSKSTFLSRIAHKSSTVAPPLAGLTHLQSCVEVNLLGQPELHIMQFQTSCLNPGCWNYAICSH